MRTHAKNRRVAYDYMCIKEDLLQAGYDWEIDWQSDLCFKNTTEQEFMREAAWVVLSSGFRESVVRTIFPAVSDAFLNWGSCEEIYRTRSKCARRALGVFRNVPKIEAIAEIASIIANDGWSQWKENIKKFGPSTLQRFPFIGPITSVHLSKNIGLPLAKPDRHLVRLAKNFGYNSAEELCEQISFVVGDSVAVVDVVLWRYATINSIKGKWNGYVPRCGGQKGSNVENRIIPASLPL